MSGIDEGPARPGAKEPVGAGRAARRRRFGVGQRSASRGMRQLGAAALLGALLALAGCGTTPPSVFYTLTPIPASDVPVAQVSVPVGIGLGPLTFPAFLDRPQIVSRDAKNRLNLDELNRWGGNLQDDFVRVLSENLSYLLGTSRIVVFPSEVRYPLDYRITADVLRFEGAPNGEAILKVRWAVLDPLLEKALAVNEGTYRRPYSAPAAVSGGASGASAGSGSGSGEVSENRSALIAALSATLADFSRDVAAVVRGLPRPPPPPADAPPI